MAYMEYLQVQAARLVELKMRAADLGPCCHSASLCSALEAGGARVCVGGFAVTPGRFALLWPPRVLAPALPNPELCKQAP